MELHINTSKHIRQPYVDYTFQTFISEGHKNTFILINYVILCGAISLFGTVANIINLIIFYKQGFQTTINISLFSLTVSDLASLVLQQLSNIYVNPLVVQLDLPVIYTELQHLTTLIKREMFAKITCYITVLITSERCLCIAFPLHVKQMVTPRRTTFIVILIYSVNVISTFPVFGTTYIDWKFYPDRNRSLLSLAFREYKEIAEASVYFFHAITGALAFLAVLVLTLILVHKLRQKNNWRQSSSVCDYSMSQRDRATVKMVVLIAGVLILCYLPSVLLCIVTFVEPEFIIGGVFNNLFYSSWSIAILMENINSSVNIFLYYNMSSKYRQTWKDLYASCRINKSVVND